jgi:hypothetical protein
MPEMPRGFRNWERLTFLLERLNAFSVNRYSFVSAYGRVQLVYFVNGRDTREGIVEVSPLLSSPEMEAVLGTLTRYLNAERDRLLKDMGKR